MVCDRWPDEQQHRGIKERKKNISPEGSVLAYWHGAGGPPGGNVNQTSLEQIL